MTAWSCSSRRTRSRSTSVRADGASRRPTSPSCSAATARCCGRSSASSARGCPCSASTSAASASSPRSRPTSSSTGLARVFAGELRRRWSCRRSTRRSRRAAAAVNDVVVRSADVGRMIELGWALGGEDLGSQPCDGMICSTPVGLDRLQPLERRARCSSGASTRWRSPSSRRTPCTPGRSSSRRRDLAIVNRTPDVAVAVLVDGHPSPSCGPGDARRRRRAAASKRTLPRVPAREVDLLPPLPRTRLCSVGSASRTSSSSARPSSSSRPG